jgi:hypothetical protein
MFMFAKSGDINNTICQTFASGRVVAVSKAWSLSCYSVLTPTWFIDVYWGLLQPTIINYGILC